jgi:hypothetical protein
MRLLSSIVLAAITVVAHPSASSAQEVSASHLEAARQLLEITNARAMMEQSMQAARNMLAPDSAQAKALAEFDQLIDEFLAEHFSWTVLEPEFVQLYVEMFTEAELRELTAFYQTDLGQKMLLRMPEVMQRSMAITQHHLQEALPQLMQRIQAERTKRRRRRPL